MANLYQKYVEEIRPRLLAEGGYANVMQVPRLTKVTLNMGVGEAVGDRKIMEAAVADHGSDLGSEADRHQCPQIRSRLQDP
jgi:large subunit ribosomal protein L5